MQTKLLAQARIGNRWQLAVECEVSTDPRLPRNEWIGSLWLWIAGQPVGNPAATEMLSIGLETLEEAATESGRRENKMLSSLPAERALSLVLWARYGDDNDENQQLVLGQGNLETFEILPRRGGPFFDGWEGIIIEEKGGERFIWKRSEDKDVCEVALSTGEFGRVIKEARRWFDDLHESQH